MNRVSDSVSIVDLTAGNVVATLTVGDEPADVVFAGAPQRAFVSISEENAVAGLRSREPRDRADDHRDPGQEPARARDRRHARLRRDLRVGQPLDGAAGEHRVRARRAPTAARTRRPTAAPSSIRRSRPAFRRRRRPRSSSTRKASNWKDDNNHLWDAFVTWNLNENDVAVIQASTLTVTGYAKDLLNINMAIAVNPANGRVTTVGTYGPNEHRFEQATRNNLRTRAATFDPSNLGQRRHRRPEPASLPEPAEPAVPEDDRDADRAAPVGERSARRRLARRRQRRVRERHGLEQRREDGGERHAAGDDRRRRRPDRRRARRGAQPALRPEPLRGLGVVGQHREQQRGRARHVLRSDAGRHQDRPPAPLRRAPHLAARQLRVRRLPRRRQPRHRGLGSRRSRRAPCRRSISRATRAPVSPAPATTGIR